MTEPAKRFPWRHERRNEIRLYIDDELEQDTKDGIIRKFAETIGGLQTASQVRDFAAGVGVDEWLRVAVITEPDHCDPLGDLISIAYSPHDEVER